MTYRSVHAARGPRPSGTGGVSPHTAPGGRLRITSFR